MATRLQMLATRHCVDSSLFPDSQPRAGFGSAAMYVSGDIIGLIWLFFLLDRFLPLETLALWPRRMSGLPGILASPFLHLDLQHVVSNTVPLLVLMNLLAGSRANSGRTVAILIILSGGLLWVFGRPVPVIGASGLIFALIGFLIFYGVLERRLVTLLVSAFVPFSYGGTLFLGVLPGQPGVSWDGHPFGAIGGVVAAWFLARRR